MTRGLARNTVAQEVNVQDVRRVLRVAVALLMSVAFAYALFISMTSLGKPIGPVETVVVWALTAWLGWATFRRWDRLRYASPGFGAGGLGEYIADFGCWLQADRTRGGRVHVAFLLSTLWRRGQLVGR